MHRSVRVRVARLLRSCVILSRQSRQSGWQSRQSGGSGAASALLRHPLTQLLDRLAAVLARRLLLALVDLGQLLPGEQTGGGGRPSGSRQARGQRRGGHGGCGSRQRPVGPAGAQVRVDAGRTFWMSSTPRRCSS
eukprot:7391785-Prymnesium_polylepis.3